MAADLPAKHVPAWKRIGLKLKYAKDTPEPSPRQNDSKRPQSDQDSLGPSKRRRTSPQEEVPESEPRRKSVTFTPETKTEDGFSASKIFKQWMTPPLQPVTSSTEDASDTSPSPKKIAKPVQPSIDTKASVKDLESTSPSSQSSQEPPTQKEKKKEKKPKRSKAASAPVTGSTTAAAAPAEGHQPEYLRYLTTFHADKATWKFNKNKQTELLKHCLDTTKIPPEHTAALKDYLRGLKGAALARKLFESADTQLKTRMSTYKSLAEFAGNENPAARKLAYEVQLKKDEEEIERQVKAWEDALDNGYQLSPEEIEEIKDARRAKQEDLRFYAVAEALLWNDLHPERPAKAMPPEVPADAPLTWYKAQADKKPSHITFGDDDQDEVRTTLSSQPGKKKSRKARTTDATSSESSSSSSDDPSSSDDESDSSDDSKDSSSSEDGSDSSGASSDSDDDALGKTKKATTKSS